MYVSRNDLNANVRLNAGVLAHVKQQNYLSCMRKEDFMMTVGCC